MNRVNNANSEAGFTLIEMLVAIAILAIMLSLAVLAIPNHDDRYWRDNLNQLVSSLNLVQDEGAMSGNAIAVQIDSVGWRFYMPTPNSSASTLISVGGMVKGADGKDTVPINTNLMPDVYRAQSWHQSVNIEPVQLSLGKEEIVPILHIPIEQGRRKAVLIRSNAGRFTWVSEIPQ